MNQAVLHDDVHPERIWAEYITLRLANRMREASFNFDQKHPPPALLHPSRCSAVHLKLSHL